MDPVIVVVSHGDDVHAARVLDRLAGGGHETALLDIGEFPHAATLSIAFDDPGAPVATLRRSDGTAVDLTAAAAVWWRRPQFPDLSTIADPEASGFAHGEWHEMVNGMWQLLGGAWMNPPVADEVAHRKAHQLRLAHDVGMRVPRTLMTSDPAAAREFAASVGDVGTIYKIFAATESVWRETRRLRAPDLDLLDSLTLAPVIFQEYVPAVADVRVTVVGRRVFAMEIRPRRGAYDADFRLAMADEATDTAPVELPAPVEKHVLRLMDRLGLVYGAIDLRLTPAGEYVFLEINPAGEFLFVEAGTGLPITAAVADWLSSPTI